MSSRRLTRAPPPKVPRRDVSSGVKVEKTPKPPPPREPRTSGAKVKKTPKPPPPREPRTSRPKVGGDGVEPRGKAKIKAKTKDTVAVAKPRKPMPPSPGMNIGLHNLGNTCYLNSTLQCLKVLPPLAELVGSLGVIGKQSDHTKFLKLYKEVMDSMKAAGNRGTYYTPNDFSKEVQKHKIKGTAQFPKDRESDANEFLLYTMEKIEEGMTALDQVSEWNKVWGDGERVSHFKCTKCDLEWDSSTNKFSTLNLQIQKGTTPIKTLEKAFQYSYGSTENVECTCPNCKADTTCKKSFKISKMPKLLVLQLGRFNKGGAKLTNALDCSWNMNFTSEPNVTDSKAKYSLVAVCNHIGDTPNSGHYTAHIKDIASRGWYIANDSSVTKVDIRDAMEGSSNPYCLFYLKVEKLQPAPPPRRITDRRRSTVTSGTTGEVPASIGSKIKEYPYDPLLFFADLAIGAYCIYAQSIAFPWDPYLAKAPDKQATMIEVHEWAKEIGPANAKKSPLKGYRGPGVLGGFVNNDTHIPIVYRYANINPLKPTLTMGKYNFLWQKLPDEISRNIGKVFVAYGKPNATFLPGYDGTLSVLTHQTKIEEIPFKNKNKKAKDVMLCFEGGTGGSTGEVTKKKITTKTYKPHSQSIMGYVLMRYIAKNKYDVHVCFRGSRSAGDKSNNPDWITDLDGKADDAWFTAEAGALLVKPAHYPQVSVDPTHKVHLGFAFSLNSILPQVAKCLEKVAELSNGVKPRKITATGHSLGGALASHFASSILLGEFLNDDSTYPVMPSACKKWPWHSIKLVTFSAPRPGDPVWAEALNFALQTTYYKDTKKSRGTDSNALKPLNGKLGDYGILADLKRPKGLRVLHSADLCTSRAMGVSNHIGESVYVDHSAVKSPWSSPLKKGSKFAHEYMYVRDQIIEWLKPKYATLGDPSRFPTADTVRKFEFNELMFAYPPKASKKKTKFDLALLFEVKLVFEGYNMPFKFKDEDFTVFASLLELERYSAIAKEKLKILVAGLQEFGMMSVDGREEDNLALDD